MDTNITYLKRSLNLETIDQLPPHLFYRELSQDLNLPNAENSVYTSCYCEENVWKVCELVKKNNPEKMCHCYAVFISNPQESIALWGQKSGRPPDRFIIWDYHVIFVYNPDPEKGSLVYDLDSSLPSYPMHIDVYAPYTFKLDSFLNPCYHRFFRVVPCEKYLETFASDRSRMKKADGSWISPPPNYPCIFTPDSSNNLNCFISMNPQLGEGEVLNLDQFISRFCSERL